METLIKVSGALLLVLANAFFVLSEFSIVKIRRTRLEELKGEGNKSAALALKISHNLDSYLSATQLGVTLASLGLGWIGEPAVASLLRPLFLHLHLANEVLVHSVSAGLAFAVITLLHVVLGELVPKSAALQKTEKAVLLVSWFLYAFHKLAYPIIFLFDRIAGLCLSVLGISRKEEELSHSEGELRMIINASYKGGLLDDTEGQLLGNVFRFADKTAREAMVPRTDMVCLYLTDSYEENLNRILKAHFTRLPLCRSDKDNVIGMVHLRDVLINTNLKAAKKNFEELGREILFVPESMPVSAVMQRMKKRRIHLAVVIDEYGGTAGLITLEDILEEIVGEIQDEHDKPSSPEALAIENGGYELAGIMQQSELEKLIPINFGDRGEDTVGGFVFSLLGRAPSAGDKVLYEGYVFEVTKVDHLRIVKVKVSPSA